MREMANTTDDCQLVKDTKQKSIKSNKNGLQNQRTRTNLQRTSK